MNIAHVYPHASIPGPPVRLFDALAIVNYEIARRLARKHTVSVYAKRISGERRVEWHENVRYHRIPLQLDRALSFLKLLDTLKLTAPSRPFRLSPLYYAHYVRRVARDLRAIGCEIVHVHGQTSFIPTIRAFNPHARIVLHMHDHSLCDFDEAVIGKRLQSASLVLGCSDYVSGAIRKRFPSMADRCHTLHNGVDERFLQARSDPGRSEQVLYVGRLSPEKGVHALLEAFRQSAAAHPRSVLRLIGPADIAPKQFVDPAGLDPALRLLAHFHVRRGAYFSFLQQQAQTLGGRAQFVGPVANRRVRSELAQAGVFVFPSVWQEPFGIPVIEAMAAGLPVIATRAGAFPELVVDGETGILVDRADPQALAIAIDRLLASPDLRARMGAAARKRVARLFTWDRSVARLTDLYAQACGSAPEQVGAGGSGRLQPDHSPRLSLPSRTLRAKR